MQLIDDRMTVEKLSLDPHHAKLPPFLRIQLLTPEETEYVKDMSLRYSSLDVAYAIIQIKDLYDNDIGEQFLVPFSR